MYFVFTWNFLLSFFFGFLIIYFRCEKSLIKNIFKVIFFQKYLLIRFFYLALKKEKQNEHKNIKIVGFFLFFLFFFLLHSSKTNGEIKEKHLKKFFIL